MNFTTYLSTKIAMLVAYQVAALAVFQALDRQWIALAIVVPPGLVIGYFWSRVALWFASDGATKKGARQ